MPNRNRTTYQSQSLLIGPPVSTGQHFTQFGAESIYTGANLLTGFYRIQNCNYSFNVGRTPVMQFGETAAIDRVILDTPTVGLSFSYLLANFWNERQLGFVTDGRLPALSGITKGLTDDRNYFLKVVAEGVDAVGDTEDSSNVFVVGFGNGFLTSYSSSAAVNSFPSVDISVAALNMTFATGLSGKSPAIFPDNGTRVSQYHYVIPTILSEGIIENATGVYDVPGTNIGNANIQSYSLSFDLGREALQKLGSKYAFARTITYPIDVSLTVDALVGDLTTGSLSDMVNGDDSFDVTINIKKPVAPGDPQPVMARYVVKNAKINSHSYSNGIGDNKTVTMEFAAQIGGPNQTTVGLFMSGVTTVQ